VVGWAVWAAVEEGAVAPPDVPGAGVAPSEVPGVAGALMMPGVELGKGAAWLSLRPAPTLTPPGLTPTWTWPGAVTLTMGEGAPAGSGKRVTDLTGRGSQELGACPSQHAPQSAYLCSVPVFARLQQLG
jgi:hypothetical protein